MSLEQVGVELVAKNKALFDAAMSAVNKALDTAGDKAETSAKRSKVMETAYDSIGKAAKTAATVIDGANKQTESSINRLRDRMQAARDAIAQSLQPASGGIFDAVRGAVGDFVQKTIGGFTSIGSAVFSIFPVIGNVIGTVFSAAISIVQAFIGVLAVGVVGAVGLVGAALGGLFALAKRGSNFEDIINGFRNLTANIGLSANALLTDMRAAVRGLLPDMALLQTANQALIGLSGQFGQQFGQALPKLLEIARAAAKTTGQDFQYLFVSIVLGLRRGSPMILDNLGLIIKVGEANERYAESIGKAADQLTLMEQKQALLQAVLLAGQSLIDSAGAQVESLGDKLARAQTTITNSLDMISLALQTPFKDLLDTVNGVLGSISGAVVQLAPYIAGAAQIVVNALKTALAPIGQAAEQLNSPQAASAFAAGAAATFGSFARGVALAGVSILNTVRDIAQGIADFLLGHSPPPEGPLSRMTEGAAATMKAWLDGFTGAFTLDPIERVAQQVKDALGPIAAYTLRQVESRLAQLDKALLPFQQRLSIVKSEFDALSKVGEIAFKAIDRHMDSAVEALTKGLEGSGALVRSLDAQRDAVQAALDARQQENEQYELQLAMAEAMQARERALLEIRKSQLPVITATAKAADKAKKAAAGGAGEKPKKEKEPTGSADLPEQPGEPITAAPLEDLFPWLSSDAINEAAGVLTDNFDAVFGDAGDQLGTALSEAGTAIDTMMGAVGNLPNRLTELFSMDEGGKSQVSDALGTTIGDILTDAFDKAFATVGDRIKANVAQSQPLLAVLLGWADTAEIQFTDVTFSFGANGITISNTSAATADAAQQIVDNLSQDLDTGVDYGPATDAMIARLQAELAAELASAQPNPDLVSSIVAFLTGATTAHAGSATDSSTSAGTGLTGMLQTMVSTDIPSALSGLPAALQTNLTQPFINAVNAIRERVFGHPTFSIPAVMSVVALNVQLNLAALPSTLYTYLTLPFQTEANRINDILTGPLGLGSTLSGLALTIPASLIDLPATLESALRVPFQTALSNLIADLTFTMAGEDPTLSVPGILAVGLSYFAAFPAQIGMALKPAATFVWKNFAEPILKVLNTVLDGFRSTIQNLYDAFIHFMADIGRASATVATQTGGAFSPTIGQALNQAAQSLRDARANFTIAPVVVKVPDFVEGAATGGLFGPGVLRVHRGEQLVANASERLSVFPANVVRALDSIATLATTSVPYVSPSLVQNSYADDHSRSYGDFIVNGVQNPQGWRREWNNLKAFR